MSGQFNLTLRESAVRLPIVTQLRQARHKHRRPRFVGQVGLCAQLLAQELLLEPRLEPEADRQAGNGPILPTISIHRSRNGRSRDFQ